MFYRKVRMWFVGCLARVRVGRRMFNVLGLPTVSADVPLVDTAPTMNSIEYWKNGDLVKELYSVPLPVFKGT